MCAPDLSKCNPRVGTSGVGFFSVTEESFGKRRNEETTKRGNGETGKRGGASNPRYEGAARLTTGRRKSIAE